MTLICNDSKECYDIFVPGRICLFGEHSDWAGMFRTCNPEIATGKCLIAGTDQGLFAKVSLHPNEVHWHCTFNHGESADLTISVADLWKEATHPTSLFSYMAGVAYHIRQAYPHVGGIVINNHTTTLPVKKGLSSSAAICVLTARAFSQCYHLQLTTRQEMEFAYQGETMTVSKCGRMDQGCAYGRPILMEFNGDTVLVNDTVSIGAPIYIILVDLAASKNTPAILQELQQAYPIPTTDIHQGIHQLLGPINHTIMSQAILALKDGDAQRMGQLMTLAQDQFDQFAIPASPNHLTSPVLHHVLTHYKLQPFIHGGKGVGSQGDGSAQFVAKTKEDQQKAISIIETELGMSCLSLTLGAIKNE